jgi:hypothetical protein
MTRKAPAAGSPQPAPTPQPLKPAEPIAPLARPGRASSAARLLGSKGSAPPASALPSSVGEVVPHSDSTGPQQAPSRANGHAEGPRHFRRADTWR